MTTEWALRSAVYSLDYFLLEEGAPATCKGEFETRVSCLRSDLSILELILLDEGRNIDSETKKMSKQLAHEIEDAVEYYARQEVEFKGKPASFTCLSRLYFSKPRSFPVDIYMSRTRDLVDNLKRQLSRKERSSVNPPPIKEVVMELDHHRQTIKDYLFRRSENLSVIAIVGMGGSGKTTLAHYLFNNSDVNDNFDVRCWICASEGYDIGSSLQRLLLSFPGADEEEISKMDHSPLQIYERLMGRKFLIVLDDVWTNNVWDYLQRALPDEGNRSLIIVTTRLESVARFMIPEYIHRMGSLTEDTPEAIIGMDTDREILEEYLLNPENDFSVVAICGMAGSGKTTLAHKLYMDSKKKRNFERCHWISGGHAYKLTDKLSRLVAHDFGLSDRAITEIGRMDEVDMMLIIYKQLFMLKYLIVLDDVCSIDIWQDLRVALPDNRNGSRVLVTTRQQDLAQDLAPDHTHVMHPLPEEDSWELFKLKSELRDTDFKPGSPLEKRAREIIKNCAGLPLEIVVAATMLRDDFSRDLHPSLAPKKQEGPDLKGLDRMLALSYNELPSYLKPCFLYLGQFPIDEGVLFEKLFLLWMAEGMVTPQPGKTGLQVAKSYMDQLIQTNLVAEAESDREQASKRFASCTLHDIIHDMWRKLAKDEDFVKVIDDKNGNEESNSTRRLAIHFNKWKGTHLLSNIPAKQIRSILIFDEADKEQKGCREPIDLQEFQSTRILDFSGVNFHDTNFPQGMEKLIYLKYLSFQGCCVKKLPSFIGNFPLLETLDLGVKDSLIIPNVLRELLRLRHLYFPQTFQCATKDKLKLDALKNLEILENFHSGICNSDDLKEMTKLQSLTCIVDGNNTDLRNVIDAMNMIDPRHLHHTSLVVRNFDSYSKRRFQIVKDMFSCKCIHSLEIEGYLGKLSLEDISVDFTKIVLNGSEFSREIMPKLGKLPNLKSLALSNDAFVDKDMVFPEGLFRQLRNLHLEDLQFLEKFQVEKTALPRLANLTIKRCDQLKELTQGLVEIATLEKLSIESEDEKINADRRKAKWFKDD